MLPNVVIRPIRMDDLEALYELADISGFGFTSLPLDRTFLKAKIQLSLESFNRCDAEIDSENYLMVAEDTTTQQIVGTTAVAENVGKHEVFYSYKLGRMTKACPSLGIRIHHETLTLTTDYEGVAELCTLFVRPEYRRNGIGELVSRCRFCLISEYSQRFNDVVIAEMRGISDESGHSPFWNAIGRRFFGGVKFPQADHMTGMGEKQFIADLMPEFRLYVCMLPKLAQEAIGKMHPKTEPAGRLLTKENFHYHGYIDIFDGGPTLEARKNQIYSVRKNQRLTVCGIEPNLISPRYIVTNTLLSGFRATLGYLKMVDACQVIISTDLAEKLEVSVGDPIRVIIANRQDEELV